MAQSAAASDERTKLMGQDFIYAHSGTMSPAEGETEPSCKTTYKHPGRMWSSTAGRLKIDCLSQQCSNNPIALITNVLY